MSIHLPNIAQIRETLKKYSVSAVKICGVIKKQDPELVKLTVHQGLFDLGVNYVQEGDKFRSLLPDTNIRWHFIGQIQSRKVRAIAEYDCVQSLDRLEVAKALDERLAFQRKTLCTLVQVNIGDEPQKGGVAADALDPFLEELVACQQLRITGLMALPPGLSDVEKRRPFFKKMRLLFEKYEKALAFETLSMGTSEDFIIAVQEGATMVRLGTVLFGART